MLPLSSPNQNRIPELDGLRGIAIFLVLVWHYLVAQAGVEPGTAASYAMALGRLTWSGVDLFFVLSGFLISNILLNAKEAANYYKIFYVRRAYRILPIYCVICLCFAVLTYLLGPGGDARLSSYVGAPMPWYVYATFTQNFWMTLNGTMTATWLGVTWSLAVEEQFYLTLPLIIRRVNPGHFFVTVVLIIVAAVVFRVVIFFCYPNGGIAAYTLMFCRADALLLGVIGALLMRNRRAVSVLAARRPRLRVALAFLGAGVLLMTVKGWTIGTAVMSIAGYTWLGLFYLCLLLLALTGDGGLLSRLLRLRLLTGLGSIAYGVYLLHQEFLGLCHGLLRSGSPSISSAGGLLTTLLALLLTLAAATLSWRFFESRLVRLGHSHRYSYGDAAVGGEPVAA